MKRLGKMLAPAIASALCAMSAPAAAQSEKPGEGKAVPGQPQTPQKGYHVVQVVGQVAKNNDPVLQAWLNRMFGVILLMDGGDRFAGPMAVNKKGSILASKSEGMSFSMDPEGVQLVNVAGEDGWWRRPDADNAVVLIETLRTDKDGKWRSAAAYGLSICVPTPATTTVLVTALRDDPDIRVRWVVAAGLSRIGTPEAIKAVKTALAKDSQLAQVCEVCRAAISKADAPK
jgi:hypothetical protein